MLHSQVNGTQDGIPCYQCHIIANNIIYLPKQFLYFEIPIECPEFEKMSDLLYWNDKVL